MVTHVSDDIVGTVDVSRIDDVAVIMLRRERKLNALSSHMESELLRALSSPEVKSSRAVVVTGGDTVFSAGADLAELRLMTTHDIVEYYRGSGRVYEEFAMLPQPTVAAITGYCLGGGLELALAADLRIADAAAVFGLPEIGIGILPSSGGLTRIVRAVGAGRASDLVLRGRRLNARQAEQWGIVTEISPPGRHVQCAISIARTLTEHSPLALQITKRVLNVSFDAPKEAALLLEQLSYAVLNDADEFVTSPGSER